MANISPGQNFRSVGGGGGIFCLRFHEEKVSAQAEIQPGLIFPERERQSMRIVIIRKVRKEKFETEKHSDLQALFFSKKYKNSAWHDYRIMLYSYTSSKRSFLVHLI